MTAIRPARSSGAPVWSDRVRPSGFAWTPAAQIFVTAEIDSVRPSLCFSSMPRSSTSVTIAPSTTSTPSFSSSRLVAAPSLAPNGGSTCGAASIRITRAVWVWIARKSLRSVRRESSAIWPAISTPVGPAPTTTNVRWWSTSSPRLAPSSAISKAPKIRPRSSSASSMLFMPGAYSANWSLPKYDCAAPAATISESYGVDGGPAQHHGRDLLALEVDLGDLAEQHLRVALAAQHLAGRRGDLALGEDAGRHLVEQRLEQVVGGLGDQRDVDVGSAQRLGPEQPAEAGADDHDAVALGRLLLHLHASIVLRADGHPAIRGHVWSVTPDARRNPHGKS